LIGNLIFVSDKSPSHFSSLSPLIKKILDVDALCGMIIDVFVDGRRKMVKVQWFNVKTGKTILSNNRVFHNPETYHLTSLRKNYKVSIRKGKK
jgi:hypothetical protein